LIGFGFDGSSGGSDELNRLRIQYKKIQKFTLSRHKREQKFQIFPQF
jgi:hypothetical protein